MFSIERIKEEVDYISDKALALSIINLHLVDTNFGMYSREREICNTLYRVPLSNSQFKILTIFEFKYTNNQILKRGGDYFNRYAKNINAFSKIVTRVINVESLFRKVPVVGPEEFKESK